MISNIKLPNIEETIVLYQRKLIVLSSLLTGKDYNQKYLDFIRNENKRSNRMTKSRSQPLCRSDKILIGWFDGIRVFPRTVTGRDNALFLHNKLFGIIWKSENVSYNQGFKGMIDNFKIDDNYITQENVKSHFEYIYTPEKLWLIVSYMI